MKLKAVLYARMVKYLATITLVLKKAKLIKI